MEPVTGLQALRVISWGTAPSDGELLAYVEMEFADGQRGAVFFSDPVAPMVCTSFIKAAASLAHTLHSGPFSPDLR